MLVGSVHRAPWQYMVLKHKRLLFRSSNKIAVHDMHKTFRKHKCRPWKERKQVTAKQISRTQASCLLGVFMITGSSWCLELLHCPLETCAQDSRTVTYQPKPRAVHERLQHCLPIVQHQHQHEQQQVQKHSSKPTSTVLDATKPQ
jgi:hypothetical protein